MSSILLTGCHNHHFSVSQQSLIVTMSLWQILLCCNLSLRKVDVHPGTPYPAALHFHIVSERLFTQVTSQAL